MHAGRWYTGELWAGLANDVPHHPPVHTVLHHVDLRVRDTLLATPAQTSSVDKWHLVRSRPCTALLRCCVRITGQVVDLVRAIPEWLWNYVTVALEKRTPFFTVSASPSMDHARSCADHRQCTKSATASLVTWHGHTFAAEMRWAEKGDVVGLVRGTSCCGLRCPRDDNDKQDPAGVTLQEPKSFQKWLTERSQQRHWQRHARLPEVTWGIWPRSADPSFLPSFLQPPPCSPSDTWLTRMTTFEVQTAFHCFVQSLLTTSMPSSVVKPHSNPGQSRSSTIHGSSHNVTKRFAILLLLLGVLYEVRNRTPCVCQPVAKAKYSRAPYNDVSPNDGPHTRRWSHNITIQYITTLTAVLQLPTVLSTATLCTGL